MITRHTKRQKYRLWRKWTIIIIVLAIGAWYFAELRVDNAKAKAKIVMLEQDDQ